MTARGDGLVQLPYENLRPAVYEGDLGLEDQNAQRRHLRGAARVEGAAAVDDVRGAHRDSIELRRPAARRKADQGRVKHRRPA